METEDTIRKKIINNIIKITENDNNILIDNIELKFLSNKYSAKKKNIWQIYINNINITKKSKFIFIYKCYSCNNINIISATQLLRKIRNGSINCVVCRNLIDEKREKQSIFMKGNTINSKNIENNNIIDDNEVSKNKEKISITNLHDESIIKFNNMDEEFKKEYFKFHLTIDEYKKLSKNIISFCNGKYTNIKEYIYWEIYSSNNQMIFTSIIFDPINNTIFKPHQPILLCDSCGNTWRANILEKYKNCIKILCKDCSFCNKVFKIRNYKNINNDIIIYQSKLEKKFIDMCNNENIIVKNGPNIKYLFNNKEHIYRVDFQINNILIEIKDDHIWHKKQIESGIWKAKMDVINEELKSNKYKKYYLIMPKNFNEQFKLIKQDIV